jgi:hypothetical protein
LVEGLADPGHSAVVYRKGVSCPAATHLLVVERGAGRIALIIPETKEVSTWLLVPGIRDISLSPTDPQSDVYTAEQPTTEQGLVAKVSMFQVYELDPDTRTRAPTYGLPALRMDVDYEIWESGIVRSELTLRHQEESLSDGAWVVGQLWLTNCAGTRYWAALTDEGFDFSSCPVVPESISVDAGAFYSRWGLYPLDTVCTIVFNVDMRQSVVPEDVCWVLDLQLGAPLLDPGY